MWATWLRDLLIDFGTVDAVIFCFVFGWLLGWAGNRSDETGALHYHYLEVLACFAFACGAFTSVLWFNLVSNAFFLAIGIMV